MTQQSILGRIGQLARANIHALLDAAEDPEKMRDQMVRDYTANIAEAEAEDAVAQTIGNLRLLERGDTALMDQHLADDVVWHVGGNSKWAGAYQGKQTVLEYFAVRPRPRAAPMPGCGRTWRSSSACRAASRKPRPSPRATCRPTRRPPTWPICGKC